MHAFSALEVWQGAATLGVPLRDVPRAAARRGARVAPGHGRRGARRRGARGHLPRQDLDRAVARGARDRARGRAALEQHDHVRPRRRPAQLGAAPGRACASCSSGPGGFTEFVPLPFVHMEAPIYLKGRARPGPTFGEMLLMHAVGRLALHPWIENVQVSWVKAGPAGRRRGAARRRQRPRRDADERVDLARGRRGVGAGAGAGADGGADPLGRPGAAPADDAVRRAAGRAGGALVRRGAARRAAGTRTSARRGCRSRDRLVRLAG